MVHWLKAETAGQRGLAGEKGSAKAARSQREKGGARGENDPVAFRMCVAFGGHVGSKP